MSEIIAALIAGMACLYALAYVGQALKSGAAHFSGRPVMRGGKPAAYWGLVAFFALAAVLSAIVFYNLMGNIGGISAA